MDIIMNRINRLESEINHYRSQPPPKIDHAHFHPSHPLFANESWLPHPASVVAVLPDRITKLTSETVKDALCYLVIPQKNESNILHQESVPLSTVDQVNVV
jgi:hypothetical protein